MRLSILILLLISQFTFAGEVEDVLKEVLEKFKKEQFSVDVEYKLFKSFEAQEVWDTYSGKIVQEKNGFYQKTGPAEIIATKEFFIKVNHEEKAMVYGFPNLSEEVSSIVGITDLLGKCNESKLVEKDDFIYVSFDFIGFVDIEYSKVILKIDKKTKSLVQTKFYYSNLLDFSKEYGKTDYSRPLLEVNYTNYTTKKQQKIADKFILTNYIKTKDNYLSPTGTCLGYELLDIRNN